MSCPDIFGKPNTGVHKCKLFGISIVDMISTIILAYIVSELTKDSFFKIFLIFLIIGEISHYVFRVDTAFIKFLKNFN